jgi:hypothetical protein
MSADEERPSREHDQQAPETPAAAPRAVEPPPRDLAGLDDDGSLLSRLGIPFYYRHRPLPWVRRGLFWLAFLGILVLVCGNLLLMPYRTDTVFYAIREFFFGPGFGYASFQDGARGLFYQSFVLAIVNSAIVAPLFSCFSLSSERVTGTLEFLRLAPLSSASIVMGKMFAPVYVLHLISAALLLVGFPCGLLAGLPLNEVSFALLVVVLSSATIHALGAFLACVVVSFRGFGAVAALIGVGFFLHLMPLAFGGERGVHFLSYFSPWGAMDGLFWRLTWRSATTSCELFGSEAIAGFYIAVVHVLAFLLLVRAAARKLDAAELPALTIPDWLAVWTMAIITALGILPNSFSPAQRGRPWQYAAVCLIVAGLGVCCGMLVDHPHRRELALAEECQRAADGLPRRGSWRRLGHALFVTAAAFATTILVLVFFGAAGELKELSWGWLAFAVVAPSVGCFLLALVLEASFLAYFAGWARMAAAVLACGALFVSALVPAIDLAVSHEHWRSALNAAERYHHWVASGRPKGDGDQWAERNMERLRRRPEYAVYLAGMDSAEATQKLRLTYWDDPLAFFWRYHPLACAVYAMLTLGGVAGVVLWRALTYARLRQEAERAVRAPSLPREGGVHLPHVPKTSRAADGLSGVS